MTEPTPAPKKHISFEIPGPPFSLKRARIGRHGKFARMFDPKENVSWKGAAAVHMLAARQAKGLQPFAGPVNLTVVAYFPCPKSDERKRDPRPERWSMNQKDADNILKAVGDAGNGILWLDDRQVVNANVQKRIAAQGQPPRTLVMAHEETER